MQPIAVSVGSAVGAHPLWVAVAVTLLFGGLARVVRGVSTSGAVAGGVVCFALYAGVGSEAFAGLVLVFVLTWGATRFGYQRKLRQGTAERKGGRTASQVLANVGLAAVCGVAYYLSKGNPVFLVGLSAVLAEAAADTVSSELGRALSNSARLMTTWQQVPAGTDGGVTFAGTMAGAFAGGLVALQFALTGWLSWQGAVASWGAAVVAMFADSFLGAALERRGLLNNDAVNFLSTSLAAALAMGITLV